ncbi:hypothetical protein BGZ94_008716, partial [Podila epigama]
LIDDLTKLLPPKHLEDASSKCHRVNVLRGAVSHIKFLNESNEALLRSIQSIQGHASPMIQPKTEPSSTSIPSIDIDNEVNQEGGMTMDVDDDADMDARSIADSGDDGPESDSLGLQLQKTASVTSSSRSSPATSTRLTPSESMIPPPVIITDAPSPAFEREPAAEASLRVDMFSLESHRQRSNSFTSSIGDEASPRLSHPNSPLFPPSPVSSTAHGRDNLFLSPDSQSKNNSKETTQQHLNAVSNHQSPHPSPSLPPISSLANLHLQSPRFSEETTASPSSATSSMATSSGRHRGGTTLPPLMIPEPHHLHPYHQGGPSSNSSGSNGKRSNRSSLTLSPHPPTSPLQSSDQPPISPFMLSPMFSRSPSMGPATSPALSPHPHWNHDGLPSPIGFMQGSPSLSPYHPSYSHHPDSHHSGYYPSHQSEQPHSPLPAQQQTKQHETQSNPHPSPSVSHTRHKSLQPEPIFIQEEPWNTQRKRSASSASGSKLSTSKGNRSPNPKKRTQKASSGDGGDEDSTALSPTRLVSLNASPTMLSMKRSKQAEDTVEEINEFALVVDAPAPNPAPNKNDAEFSDVTRDDNEAAQALTTLAYTAPCCQSEV